MTSEELGKLRNLLLTWREDLLFTSDVRDESSGTAHLDQKSVGRLSRMNALQSQELAKAGKERADCARQVPEGIGDLWPARSSSIIGYGPQP